MVKAVLIDDDLTTLNGLQKAVNWGLLNIEVVGTAQNGAEGLQQIHSHQPDIILTDIYMPVMDGIEMLKTLRDQGNSAEVLILSGYEDFKYAKSAVKLQVNDYLSKPVTIEEIESVLRETVEKVRLKMKSVQEDKELRDMMETNRSMTKKQLFKGLLEPGHYPNAYLEKWMDFLNIDLSGQNFSVVMIEFLKDRDRWNCKSSEWSLFTYAVQNIVDELTRDKQGIYLADIQLQSLLLIVSVPKVMKPAAADLYVKNVAEHWIETINNCLNLQVWASVGSLVTSAQELYISYREALNLMAESDKCMDKRVISADQTVDKVNTNVRRPIECFQAIADGAIQGRHELVEDKIQELRNAARSIPDVGIGALRDWAIDFVGMLTVALYDQGLRIEEVKAGFNVYKELESIYSADDLADWISGVAHQVSRYMENRGSQKHKKTIDFIIRFLHENYSEDITLDMIAEKVYLTRNYLSQIFKQATGENYNNYLTRVRMEKSKELMMNGNYKLYEISQMVGYKNNAYFSQLFKKYTGHNPSEFNQ